MTRGMRRRALACGLAVLGCGNTGSGGGLGGTSGGATAADLEQLYTAQCRQSERCGVADPSCQTNCGSDIQHPENIRKDFIDAYTTCLDAASCDSSADTCLQQAVTQLNPNWMEDAVFNECATRQNTCQSFTDDICAAALYFTETARQKLQQCINLDCDAISMCLQNLT